MKVAVLSLVALGVVAAVSAAVLIAAVMARSDDQASSVAAKEAEVEVLIATSNLSEMSLVEATFVKPRKVPKSQVPQDALLNQVQVVGKVLTRRMVEGQPFTQSCFAREGNGVYLAAAVPEGKRAMSVQLTDWSGMAGLLYPGSVVDVLVSFRALSGPQDPEMKATTLLQGLQVLAIGSQSIAADQYKDKQTGALAAQGQINTRMVTLLVDPKQAEILQLAMQNGSIALAMRNPKDTGREGRRLTRAREIMPNRNMSAVAGGEDSPAAASADVDDSASNDPALWESLILRGSVPERKRFALPKDQPQPAGERPVPAAGAASVPQAADAPAVAG